MSLAEWVIKAKELRQHGGKGGRLDILAYDAALDTYYEVEVMLGECDAAMASGPSITDCPF